MSRRTPDIDDNRTIADMSDVRRARSFTLFGGPDTGQPSSSSRSFERLGSSRDFGEELQSSEERLMLILGTLRAALSIGMVYIVGFGLAIALMLALWT